MNGDGSPFSLRVGGRESGFQSYSSMSSSVASLNLHPRLPTLTGGGGCDDVLDLDDRLSQCSGSTLSVGGASVSTLQVISISGKPKLDNVYTFFFFPSRPSPPSPTSPRCGGTSSAAPSG